LDVSIVDAKRSFDIVDILLKLTGVAVVQTDAKECGEEGSGLCGDDLTIKK
jgi:hypothetical protein